MQQEYAAALEELIALGMQLARVVAAQAARSPTLDAVTAFESAARAVRNTIILHHRLAQAPSTAPRRTEAEVRAVRDVNEDVKRQLATLERTDLDTSTRH